MERLSALQKRLSSREDNRTFEPAHMAQWLADTRNLFWIDQEKAQARFIGTPTQLQAWFDKLFIMATSCNVDMEEAIWGKYPNTCPYCKCGPQNSCTCLPQKLEPHERLNIPLPPEGLSFSQAKRMFRRIYPQRTGLLEELLDIIKEAAEVCLAKTIEELQDEFADLFARCIRLVNSVGIPLGELEV